jgi:integrase
MPTYLHPSSSQLPVPTVRRGLELLLEHTARRVRDRLRSPQTLLMQEKHAEWILGQELPPGILGEDLVKLADVPMADLTPPMLVRLIEHWQAAGGQAGGPLSLKTVAKRKSTLRRALAISAERGELVRVPDFPEIGLPPLRPRVRILRNMAELRQLLAALQVRRQEWVQTALWTIQRPGDTERMCWSDVDLRSPTPSMVIRSTKTRRPIGIRVKMPAPLVQVLRARLDRLVGAGARPAPTDRLVESWPGVSKTLPLVCVRLGLPPMSAMDLRHTGITWMVRRTGLTVAAQHWGGWSDFSMMQKYYAHALPAGLDQAADELSSMAANDNGDDPPPAAPAARASNDNGIR